MSLHHVEINDLAKSWSKVKEVVSVPHTKKQYNKMVKYLDMLIDEIGGNQNHPLASLMETLGTLIETYEKRIIPIPKQDNISILKSLMADHGLKQKDMKEIGSQGVVSEVLNGKRKLNARQIQSLSKMFNVSPAVFI
ncbi:MAG: helix-turn-helix domain-containing protein [Planctomycetia bacterium]|nr:helix-turn-helix domain-containing protein [Planctomycetia bacterium]